MTQYTQNPYGSDVMEPQQRLSLAALFAMILGIVSLVACCIGGEHGCGGGGGSAGDRGLVSISRSEGRLRGTGMAITGLVLGGLVLLIGGLWTVGAAQAGPKFFGPYGDVFVAAESGDVSLAKQVLTGEAGDKVDASMLGRSRASIRQRLGTLLAWKCRRWAFSRNGWAWGSTSRSCRRFPWSTSRTRSRCLSGLITGRGFCG